MATKSELRTDITARDTTFSRTLGKAEAEAKNFAKQVGNNLKGFITNPLHQIGAAAVGFLTYETFKSGIEGSIEAGAQFEKLSKRTGVAVSSLVMLKKTFKDNDVDADNLGQTINKMQRSIASGSTAFDQLGLKISNLKSLSATDQFNAIARAIGAIHDPAERTAKAMQIFGRSGGELLPIFENLESLGNGISYKAKIFEATAKTFEQISIAFRQAGENLRGIFLGIAAQAKDQILYIANMLKSPDFLSIGLKVGNYFKQGLDVFIGAFGHMDIVWDMVKSGLTYAFLEGLNILAAGFKTVRLYFQDGLLQTVQGLGMVIEATFIKAFAVPIAYFQAGIDSVLARIPSTLGGNGEYEQRADAQKNYDRHIQLAKAAADIQADPTSTRAQAEQAAKLFTSEMAKAEEAHQRTILGGASVDQRAQAIMAGGGPLADFGGKMLNAADGFKEGVKLFNEGTSKASSAMKASPVEDIFNAGEYGKKFSNDAQKLMAIGQAKSENAALGTTAQRISAGGGRDNTTAAAFAQNVGIFGRAKALQMAGGAQGFPDKAKPMSVAEQREFINTHGQSAFDALKAANNGKVPDSRIHNPGVTQTAANAPQPNATTAQAVQYAGGGYGRYANGNTGGVAGYGGEMQLDHAYHQIRRGDHQRQVSAEKAAQNKSGEKGTNDIYTLLEETLK